MTAIFYRFDDGNETDRMTKITKIVFSLHYEYKRAAELVSGITVDGELMPKNL